MTAAPLKPQDDTVLAVGHRCHAYWTIYYHAAWACPCGAVYRDECKTETWAPQDLAAKKD